LIILSAQITTQAAARAAAARGVESRFGRQQTGGGRVPCASGPARTDHAEGR
jgi:hypothetical protein